MECFTEQYWGGGAPHCTGLCAGQITGTVTVSTGAVVPNSKVVLTNIKTNLKRETSTNDAGSYSFPLLPVGVYSVTRPVLGEWRKAKGWPRIR